ncbi:centromere protein W [Myripristis murdjan]|uniref:Centromere protein W n=1 Tax=Myripristis murdjan TaxID=586833 RepID=A0A668ARL9_9TELE|nr:centromere protein W [Myripristis murdjan]
MIKKAPRSQLKALIKTKAKSNVNLRPAADAMVELVILLFLNGLAEEARATAVEDRSATIRAKHLRAVSKKMLKKARG